ncbi:MAG: chemotaxis-specific protein-glutamate methyltransferase CheB [Polyangiaceae bacterium]|nr:chemotaxis-specific protein-glutamate methyltransferase CheB [Polyangiaceae bacterium]
MPKVRVLVVEDSVTIRERLREVLASDPEVEAVAVVGDGKEAIERCAELRPDVVSLDMILPVMSGLAATEYIMAHCPTPILIVSSSTNRGEIFKTCDALAAGAVDVLEKPRGDEPEGEWERKYLRALKLVSRIKVITHLRARLGPLGWPGSLGRATPAAPRPAVTLPPTGTVYRVAALGASTGGPGALVDILRALPVNLAIPMFFVLHIDEPFGLAFAEWLDAQTPHRVVYAKEGDSVSGLTGKVVMAPPGRHLVLRGGRVQLTNDAERHSCRPSIDVLFESVAREYGAAAIAGLLTGMGRDGAAGLLEIKRAGGHTMAQDEATSVVYGMPREAVVLGAVDRVLPPADIALVIWALANKERGGLR